MPYPIPTSIYDWGEAFLVAQRLDCLPTVRWRPTRRKLLVSGGQYLLLRFIHTELLVTTASNGDTDFIFT